MVDQQPFPDQPLRRPSKSITVTTPDGRPLNFAPQQPPQSQIPTPAETPPATVFSPASKTTKMPSSSNQDSTLDVYARRFIPDSFYLVNDLPAICVDSQPVEEPFLSTFFLRHPSVVYLLKHDRLSALPPTNLQETVTVPLPSDLNTQNYYSYFRQALSYEEAALSTECADQALYNVPLWYQDIQHDVFKVHVPGLREHRLRIEIGDVVQLRQVRLDPRTGRPILPNSLVPIVQYNAVVYAAIRVHEMLLLRINGLVPERAMAFNVVFLPQEKRLRGLRRAISFARDALSVSQHAEHQSEENGARETWNGEDKTHADHENSTSDTRSFFEEWPALPSASKISREKEMAPPTSPGTSVSENDSWIRRMLFPLSGDGELQTTLNAGTFGMNVFDEHLNYEQLKAVTSISKMNYGDVPFLISGPPGTGKTKTIVETALQLVNGNTQAQHIIVCAPSDSAADTLALRLSDHLQPDQLFRLNGTSRTFSEVPEKLLVYSYADGPDNLFSLPEFPKLMRYKVIVTTCQDVDILTRARVTNRDLHAIESGIFRDLHPSDPVDKRFRLHWGALLMDEAAQATEPQSLIPISVVAPPDDEFTIAMRPLLIMAGDQRQLGPRTASKAIAIDTSLFERLFDRALYRDHPLARSRHRDASELTAAMLPIIRPPFCILKRNYRSHPAILAVPSALFYNDTLVPEAADTEALTGWDGWKGRKWPVMLSVNTGTDEIETEGGGWFNLTEARIACQYAKDLVKSGLVAEEDICIMSPFRAQVRVLRGIIKVDPWRLYKVNIGPLEAFQGLESRVVILCTTRTRDRFIDQDLARGLGVMYEAKRFNVALTRAKQGLIVIGNPSLLANDSNWNTFLSMCHRHGLWDDKANKGPLLPPWRPKDTSTPSHISRLEVGLVYAEDVASRSDYRGGSDEMSRRMSAMGVFDSRGTGMDDAMWISGLTAEAALREE